MHRRMRALILACLLGCAPAPSRSASPTCTDHGLPEVEFIAGTHREATKSGFVEEQWSRPCAGMMLGVGRVVDQGKTVFFEYLRIERRPLGVFYVAQPEGGAATEWKLVEQRANYAMFENPLHDFPRVVLYERKGAHLVTIVTGIENGNERRVEHRLEGQP